MYYFATDGSYGDAESIVVVDTRSFTGSDWTAIENAGDSERIDVVNRIVASILKANSQNQLELF